MGRKRHTPEQIITALREAEVGLARAGRRSSTCSNRPRSRVRAGSWRGSSWPVPASTAGP